MQKNVQENPHLPEGSSKSNTSVKQKKRKAIDKIKQPDDDEISASQETNGSSQRSHLTALSQPSQRLGHKERMLWLQERRVTGIWVNCDTCSNWRYMRHVHDPLDLPEKWNCSMNPDAKYSTCFGKEKKLKIAEEEELIHNEYSAGSVVWAKMSGYPWWPAMVDDCPEVEQYYWLDGDSNIPTHYNVVFFDSEDATRSWVTPDFLKPFNTTQSFVEAKPLRLYKERLWVAREQAEHAKALPIKERLTTYCFVNRYNGPINSPIKPTTSCSDSSRCSSMCLEQPEQIVLNNTAPQTEEKNPNSNSTDSPPIPSSSVDASQAPEKYPDPIEKTPSTPNTMESPIQWKDLELPEEAGKLLISSEEDFDFDF